MCYEEVALVLRLSAASNDLVEISALKKSICRNHWVIGNLVECLGCYFVGRIRQLRRWWIVSLCSKNSVGFGFR